jgi:transcriptional regulator GlxA family with amidase domain
VEVIAVALGRKGGREQIVLVAYPGCSLLELVSAQCIWATASMLSSMRTVVVGPDTDFTSSNTPLSFKAQKDFAAAPDPDVLVVVGGGEASEVACQDPSLMDYVRRAAARASIVTSIGTGSLVLAAAGLLRGRQATTHWAFRKQLGATGARYRANARVEDGKYVTGAGSSSAIDLSLLLLARLRSEQFARRVQIVVEWDPAPPFGGIDWTAVDAVSPRAADTSNGADPRQIALVIYEGLTVLDLVGPLGVMSALSQLRPECIPVVVAEETAPVTSDSGLTFQPNASFTDMPAPDVLIVPGGSRPTLRAMSDPALRQYLRTASSTAAFTTSVCTGALLLASVGLLQGREATTHWAYRAYLPAFGARYVQRRWVDHGGMINSAGVSAGIDMALHLVAELTNETVASQAQLALHYDPDPPFGGIDYDGLPVRMRVVRSLLAATVPLYARKPRQLLKRGT